MTDWRDKLQTPQYDRRIRKGTVLSRHSYDWTRINEMRSTDDLRTGAAKVETAPEVMPIPEAPAEPIANPRKPIAKQFKHEHPIWTAARIKALRKRLDMSQREFGEALGFQGEHKKVTIHRYEMAHREPSAQTIILMEQLEKQLMDKNI